MKQSAASILCVDLDRTLIHQDTSVTVLKAFIKKNSYKFIHSLFQFGLVPSLFKDDIICQSDLSSFSWTFNRGIINFIEDARAKGIEIWLVTGSSKHIASFFCQATGLFTDYICSDRTTKLKGWSKAETLKVKFGDGNFDYVGDALKDRYVFSYAKNCFAPIQSKKKFVFIRNRYRITFL